MCIMHSIGSDRSLRNDSTSASSRSADPYRDEKRMSKKGKSTVSDGRKTISAKRNHFGSGNANASGRSGGNEGERNERNSLCALNHYVSFSFHLFGFHQLLSLFLSVSLWSISRIEKQSLIKLYKRVFFALITIRCIRTTFVRNLNRSAGI